MQDKSMTHEDEYIKKQEIDRKKMVEEKYLKNFSETERKRLRELHFMRCPKCGMELYEFEHKGITVDKCSDCNGIWFDAGEFESLTNLNKTTLDKLFDVFKK